MITETYTTINLTRLQILNLNRKNIPYEIISSENDISEVKIKILDAPKSMKIVITAVCEICKSENSITLKKYFVNFNRNNKGFYSCFKCKTLELKKTCLEKYGVDSFSKTNEYKSSESLKWKGIQKGSEKGRKTNMERYGVESYFQTDLMRSQNREWMSSDEFKEKSKISMIEKYGVDHYSKTDQFKSGISDMKDIIVSKIRKTFMERYGVDWVFKLKSAKDSYQKNIVEIREKIKSTCLEKYGVDNVAKNKDIYDKIKNTRVLRGLNIPDDKLTEWEIYKKKSRNLTRKNSKILFENWDGNDYYDGENIKQYLSLSHVNPNYPTIDHKISVFYGFINKISIEEICSMENLCITKRTINSQKRSSIEEEFILNL